MFLLGMLCLRLPSVHSDFGFAIRTYRTPRNLPSLTLAFGLGPYTVCFLVR